jgi:hypothetical protein
MPRLERRFTALEEAATEGLPRNLGGYEIDRSGDGVGVVASRDQKGLLFLVL